MVTFVGLPIQLKSVLKLNCTPTEGETQLKIENLGQNYLCLKSIFSRAKAESFNCTLLEITYLKHQFPGKILISRFLIYLAYTMCD